MRNGKKLLVMEAPLSVGSPTRGTEDAYRALVGTGLDKILGDAADFLPFDDARSVTERLCDDRLLHLETVMHVCRANLRRARRAMMDGYIPVTLGGDHSLAMSSIAALAERYGAERVAVIYVDSHADINTEETTPSGMIHGMPLAAAMGLCSDLPDVGKNKVNLLGKNTYIIGAHSIDPGEYPTIEEEGVHLYTADEVKSRGAKDIVREVLEATEGMKIHLSFDVDSINADDFPATGYAMRDSLPLAAVKQILEGVWRGAVVSSLDVVEYNPRLDVGGRCRDILFDIFKLFCE